MPRWTETDLQRFEARKFEVSNPTDDACDKESELHDAIINECKRRGWLYFHGSMAHKAMRTLGEPDFVVLADNGRVFLIEAKTRTGKLTPEQIGLKMMAEKLGHEIHCVRSFQEFLQKIAS